jgi:hypothetical protein
MKKKIALVTGGFTGESVISLKSAATERAMMYLQSTSTQGIGII